MVLFEERYHPLIIIVGWGSHAEADFEQYRTCFARWSAQKTRVLVLTDPRAQEVPSAHWRRRFAELADYIMETAPGVTVANAAVLNSALAVGAARAVTWLRRSGDQTHYCTSAVDALAWLAKQGEPDGLRIPDGAAGLAGDLDTCARRGDPPARLFAQDQPRS